MNLGGHIYRFLISNDSVSLDGFGVFQAVLEPPVISADKSGIAPPRKKIHFKQSTALEPSPLSEAFVKFVAEEAQKSVENVSVEIKSALQDWKSTLESGSTLEINDLGRLTPHDNHYVFHQKEGLVFPVEFGLEPVKILTKSTPLAEPTPPKPIIPPPPKPIEKRETENPTYDSRSPSKPHLPPQQALPDIEAELSSSQDFSKINVSPRKILMSRTNLIIVIVFAVIALGMLYFIFDPFSSNKLQTVQLPGDLYTNSNDTLPLEEEIKEMPLIKSDDSPSNTDSIAPVQNQEPSNSEEAPSFHVVGGSFRFDSNAQKFLSQLKSMGYDKAIYIGQTSDGFHRVSYGSFSTKEEAMEFLRQIRKTTDNRAWLLITK